MTDPHESIASPADSNQLFVEENERYHLSLTLNRQQTECLAEIEIFPPCPSSDDGSDAGDTLERNADNEPELPPDHEEIDSQPLSTKQLKPVISPPELLWILHQNNIVQTIDYPAVYQFCAAIELEGPAEPTVVARGIEAQKGDDGWFELAIKISGDEIELQEDESGRVDPKSLNAYSEIVAGQRLGIVHSPRVGIPGMSVQGSVIVAEAGQSFELKAGEGALLKFDNRVAYAEKSGRALLEKQTISVVDLLVIPGDVDLTIGNIDFNGFVEVKGEVPDDFDVKSTKGLKLAGPVGACQIESDGAIEMTSMFGKNSGRIVCHGDLRASFLNQVTVFCYGDVTVSNEIRNSQVKATGRVIVEKGGIIGGKCVAYRGVEAKHIGTTSGQKTELTSGIYFPDADRFVYLRHRAKNIDLHLRSVSDAIDALKQLLTREVGIAETAKRRLTILSEQLRRLEEEKQQTSSEIKTSTPQEPSGRNPKINVHTMLQEGVMLSLGSSTVEIKNARRGPLSIIENTLDGGMRYLSLTELSVSAGMIEQLAHETELSSDLDSNTPSQI